MPAHFLEKIDFFLYPFFDLFQFMPSSLIQCLNILGDIKLILVLFFLLSLNQLKKSKDFASKTHYRFLSLSSLFIVLYILKITITRVRPEFAALNLSPLSISDHLFRNEFHSFPSSHAAVAIFFVMNFRKSFILNFLAIAMCISRVVAKQHYPTDVIGGIIVGYTLYRLGNWVYLKILEKKKKGQVNHMPFKRSN